MKRFTLIELVVSIAISAIAITGAVVFIQNMLASVQQPQIIAVRSNNFRSVCHRIRNDHKKNYKNNLSSFKTAVGSAGTTQNNDYGSYRVIQSRFVSFDENNLNYEETTESSSNLLKIKIADYQGSETATMLFSGESTDE